MTKTRDPKDVDTLPDIAEALAVGICTFNFTPDPDAPPRPHGEACQQICGYCRAHAEYLVEIMSDYEVRGEA